MPYDPNIEREVIENCYFKDDGSHRSLMSGLTLPVDSDEVVRNKRFVDCHMHPACSNVVFDQCEFVDCQVSEWTRRNWTNCVFVGC